MSDLEVEIRNVWAIDVRPLVAEAWRCYNAGALRAAVASTWTAVTADLIDKIGRLASEGEGVASTLMQQVEEARREGLNGEGVKKMQQVEKELLDRAHDLELIDAIGKRELERIREDRNLCVHTSLRHHGERYEPRAEVARAHLATALSTLLTHPPTQGRKVLEKFTDQISDPVWKLSVEELRATYFDRLRNATKRNVMKVSAKHALEIAQMPVIELTEQVIADRMALAFGAFAERNRDLAREVLHDQFSAFREQPPSKQLRGLARLGHIDVFWDEVDTGLAEHFGDLLSQPVDAEELSGDLAKQLSIVRSPIASLSTFSCKARQNVTCLLVDGEASGEVDDKRVERSLPAVGSCT